MKASGSFGNLVQGVSQQPSQDRRDGQIGEMVNMIPDPVNGLSRRHGSKWVAERDMGLPVSYFSEMQTDTNSWRTFEYNNKGKDYVLLYRSATKAERSDLPPVLVYNRTDSVFIPVQRNVADAVLDAFEYGGCSGITAIGKYVFFAGHSIIPTASTVDAWGAASNQDKAVVWIRGGGYSRTFKVNAVKVGGATVTFEYTTPKSSYSGTLDTSGVAQLILDQAGGTDSRTEGAYITVVDGTPIHTLMWANWQPSALTANKGVSTMTNVYPGLPANNTQYSWGTGAAAVVFHSSNVGATDVTLNYTSAKTVINPNYTHIVTDMTNAYNSAVTKHIGDSAEAIQPQTIAEQLKLAAIAVGLTTATRQDSAVILEGVTSVTVQDGGDGSLVRGVANEVSSADQVSNLHKVGKVVKVRARGSEEAFYLKAVAKDPSVTTGYTEVSWVEAAGVVYTITGALVLGTVHNGNFCMAGSAPLLQALVPGDHPTMMPSSVGDADTSPLPFFVGRKISYLGVFQDRLLIGSGGVIRASRIGDYLNLFRTTVLSAPANDALEMLSQSSEDDELRFSVLYDRDLVIFGAKRQYVISGRSALSPSNANMPVMSTHEGAGDIPPVAAGGVIFYSKQGQTSPSVHETRPGQVAEASESYSISSQLTSYLKGSVIELATMAKPSMLFARTSGARKSIYAFSYLDTSQGRRQDAWGLWDFSDDVGVVVGMIGTPTGLLVFTLRTSHNKVWVVADQCPLTTGLAEYPYLDSVRPWNQVSSYAGSLKPTTTGGFAVAFDNSTDIRFIGGPLSTAWELLEEFPMGSVLWAGAYQRSYMTPTNPFVKDRNGKSVMSGRLTVSKLLLSINDTSGFTAEVSSKAGMYAIPFNGYIVGEDTSVIGRVPISQGTISVPVGKETREYTMQVSANTWLPFNITSIEWVGQFFNNTQRLG